MLFGALFSQHNMTKVPTETILIALCVVLSFANASYVDYSYCREYETDPTDEAVGDNGLPLLFMGWTWDKIYYLSTFNYTGDFFLSAFNHCERFGLSIATVVTACEYGIIDSWFKDHYPTSYSCWIGGIRLGRYRGPTWLSGTPIDMSQYNVNIDFVGGQYPPGGYDPIPYPWSNCMSVGRNCQPYTSGPTNPCEQTPTEPELQFSWDDCRYDEHRVICQYPIYVKKDSEASTKKRPDRFGPFPPQD